MKKHGNGSGAAWFLAVALMAILAHPVGAQTNLATLVADGAWTWFNDPRALFHNGVLYFGYVRGADGRSVLSTYNPATGVGTNLWASSSAQADDHGNPALLVKADGRMLALHARHGVDPFFSYRLSLTTNPISPADWSAEQSILPTAAGLTYANPYQLTGEGGKIYDYCRDLNYNPTVLTSMDGGSNWSAPTLFIKTGGGKTRPYVKYCSDSAERVDFLYTDGHPRDVANSLYHMYYRGGALHKTDGSFLKNFNEIPLLHDEGERGSVIYQFSDAETSDPNDHIPTGRAWCWEVVHQTNGAPACVFSVQCDRVTGTNWFDDRIYYYYARWTGTEWQKRFIAQAGRPLYNPENDYAGGICVDPENPNVVYVSTDAAEPFNLASTTNVALRAHERFEIFRGVTTDGGLTFNWTAVTTNSPVDNLRPYVPRHQGDAASLVWFRGVYGGFSRFNCSVVGLFAQPPPREDRSEYESRLWRTEDGLPHNSVQAITQTRSGFLWIGTRQGLVQFNGTHFKSFQELTNIPITTLCEDLENTLWIGTDGAGIRRYRAGKFLPPEAGTNSAGATVRTIFAARDGSVWVGTSDGLSRFENGKITQSFEHVLARSLGEDRDGRLLAATAGGLKTIKDGQLCDASSFTKLSVQAVRTGRDGGIRVADSGGVRCLRGDESTVVVGREKLGFNVVNVLYEDRAGKLWIGTSSGLNYLGQDGALHEIRHEGELLDLVFSICEDHEGNIWVGARDGLHRLNPRCFTTYTKQHGLANNDVTSVLQDASGRLWVGTWGGGLHLLINGNISRVVSTNQWFNDLVLGLATDRNGDLWVGTDYDGGMFRYERGQFIRYWKEQGISSLADPAVRAILVDNNKGRVWVGSRDALNVAYRGKAFRRFTTDSGIAGNSVRVIFEDKEGNVWVGTNDGLSEFRDDGGPVNFTTQNGLSNNKVAAIQQDREGTLWIGTAGGGLNRFKDGQFRAYHEGQGLLSDEILEIIEDNFDRLWMTCRDGVFWVARRDFDELDSGRIHAVRSVSYGRDDGLLSATCNNMAKPSACKTEDGKLWFATVKGLSVVDPAAIPATHGLQSPVEIEEVLCDGKPFAPVEELELPAGRGELEFHFTALSFRGPERDRFKYKLEPVDTEWTDAGNRRFAHYNNIYHGHYRFRVLACNSDGVWNETGASVAIALLPHFWQTLWFRLALVAGAGLLAGSIYKVRVGQIKQMERLRLRIAADLHDEIGSSMGSISLLTRKIQKEGALAKEQQGDLSSINRISTQAANSIRDIVWFVNPEYDTMQDLVLRMKDTANTMLSGIEVRFEGAPENLGRKLSLDFRRNLFLMFKELVGNIARHSQATVVEVVISEQSEFWELRVSDNGVGFDAATIHAGNGLQNLQRRSVRLGGSLEIQSQPGKGTTVTFRTGRL